jgi:hypothetical protein
VIQWLAPLRFASLVARGFTPLTPSVAKPTVEHDENLGRLRERRAKIIVDMPILS